MEQLKYIIIGDPGSPSFTFDGDSILSISGDFSVDMIGAELCTDVMEAEVVYDDTDGTLRALPWATPIYFYYGEHLEGKFYSVSVTRIGKKVYRIRAASAAGIMDYDKFYGGIYSGETFRTVVESIIGSNGLQPYAGVYSRLYREASAAGTRGLCMGAYGNEKYPEEDENAAFLSATMASKLSAKVKINGFDPPTTAIHFGYEWQCSIIGADTPHQYSFPKNEKYRYGLYMYVTRQSTDIPWPSFGEVFFVYGTTKISLGTPVSADEAVYEINVDPDAGTAVINGVTYTITLDSSLANVLCPIHVYGGGVTFAPGYSSGERVVNCLIHNCNLEVYYYIIRDSAGNLQASYAGVRDDTRGTINIYDCVSHKCLQNAPYSLVSPADLEPYDQSIYGTNLLFNKRTDFQTDVLARLSYADGIDTISTHGWMAICTKREALQQLLFATGVILIKNDDGSVLFTAPSPVSSEDGDDDAIYDVGSEDQPDHVNTVTLTENTYSLDTLSEDETIYESDALSSGYYVAEFANAPAMQTGSSGLTCVCANCNAAIVTGQGTLTGKLYSRTTRELQREIANYPDGHMVSVPDATLVTLVNSENILDRLAAYYGSASKIRIDMATNGERCGLKYDRSSAFGEPFSGYLTRISKTISSIVRGACEFIQGYIPGQIGNSYENYVILTRSGTWTVPASVFEKETPRIHVVLIGGGYGGDSGYAGENGMQPGLSEGSEPAEGGAIGESGVGGKIFEITITAPAASYVYNCGQGGIGGAISYSHDSNNPGSPGGDTTISDGNQNYSSANGATRENGIWNIINGQQYAGRTFRSRIPDIAARSAGGPGGYDSSESWGSQPHMGGDCQEWEMDTELAVWHGALNGDEYRSNGWVHARGGGGGGGGCGQKGEPGSDASYSGGKYRSGNGGKGGNATKVPSKATDFNSYYYGFGGLGGGGGGGGGAGGWVLGAQGKTYVVGTGGNGGYGGQGGDGGDGCVLIYY